MSLARQASASSNSACSARSLLARPTPNEIAVATSRMIAPTRFSIAENRHVAAADVEADARDADLLLVGDDSADRLRVAEVTVGADDAGDDVADRHAVTHLCDGCVLVPAEHLQRRVLEPLLLRPQLRDALGGLADLARQLLLAGSVTVKRPRRLAAAHADARIRLDTRGETQLAGTLTVWVRSHG
jgi:hypothetical protein